MMTAALFLMIGNSFVELGLAPQGFANIAGVMTLIMGLGLVNLGLANRKKAKKNWKAWLLLGITLCLTGIGELLISGGNPYPESASLRFRDKIGVLMLIAGIYFLDRGWTKRKQAEKNCKRWLLFGMTLCLLGIAAFAI